MTYHIDKNKVAGVIVETNTALAGRGFNDGEVIIGLGELIGRIIVETAKGPIQCKEMVTVVVEHLDRTIKAGAEARERRIILGG
jgi:hypothetical protein